MQEFFSVHYEDLLSYGKTITPSVSIVEDCIQDLFLKFCENQDLIDSIESPRSYLKTSLRRSIILHTNNQRTKQDIKLIDISVPSYEEMLISKQSNLQDSLRIKKILEVLSPSQKTILSLRFYKNLSYVEIAEKLDITKRTVYNQVHQALKKIKHNISTKS